MSRDVRFAGKTVYVLGAGASCHNEAPLLSDFLVTARRLFKSDSKELRHVSAFERAFTWIDALRASAYYVDFDLDNLEHVFSLADMSRQLGLEQPGVGDHDHYSDLLQIILDVLGRCHVPWDRRNARAHPDQIYDRFVSVYLGIQREGHLPQWDPIITFNYDVLLDQAVTALGSPLHYGFEDGDNNPLILKLHGSMNWLWCQRCSNVCVHKDLDIPIPGQDVSGERLTLRMPWTESKQTPCVQCASQEPSAMLSPLMIPPTWSKAVQGTPIGKVWARAVKEMREAFQIVVIGYSLPPTDTFFQYLLTLGLTMNPDLYRIVVVNPDATPEFRERYAKVFSRTMQVRKRLLFENIGFAEFADKRMERLGRFF